MNIIYLLTPKTPVFDDNLNHHLAANHTPLPVTEMHQ
jgi:hypothetical protein